MNERKGRPEYIGNMKAVDVSLSTLFAYIAHVQIVNRIEFPLRAKGRLK
jgi:hypothetical protein